MENHAKSIKIKFIYFFFREIACKGYSQFGSLHGTARVDGDNQEGDAMYLYGFRTRRHLQNDCDKNIMEFFAMKNITGDALRLVSSNGESLIINSFQR
jgi:hypothetical protein